MDSGKSPAGDTLLHHGGGLRAAIRRYGHAPEQWLDLSTGINPSAWPAPPLPDGIWQRLPEDDDELADTASAYYRGPRPLPVAGSQAAIQGLPALRSPCCVGVISPGYAEHAHGWRRQGHEVIELTAETIDSTIDRLDCLVMIQPNNPTGLRLPRDRLLDYRRRLAQRSGWLIVDEAFMDTTPAESLVAAVDEHDGLIVLRSLGKFFGLAGARVGFVFAEPALLGRLQALLGPWTISPAARWLARQALADRHWQRRMRMQLTTSGLRLQSLLRNSGLLPAGGCSLFQWCPHPQAESIHERLAQQAILTRLFAQPAAIRFGLPANEDDWLRLATTLPDIVATVAPAP